MGKANSLSTMKGTLNQRVKKKKAYWLKKKTHHLGYYPLFIPLLCARVCVMECACGWVCVCVCVGLSVRVCVCLFYLFIMAKDRRAEVQKTFIFLSYQKSPVPGVSGRIKTLLSFFLKFSWNNTPQQLGSKFWDRRRHSQPSGQLKAQL